MTRRLLAPALAFLLINAGGILAQAPPPRNVQAPRQNTPQDPAISHPLDRPLPDSRVFLEESLKRLRSNDLLRSQYTYQEKESRFSHDSAGRVSKTQVRVYDVNPSPEPELTYRRLVSENGVRPADIAKRDADQLRKEREWLAKRQREGLNARQARLRREEAEDRKERAVVDELTSLFEFRMTGRDTVEGRPAIQFSIEPRIGYHPRTPEGRIIKGFRGLAWVDEEDHELVRLKTEVLETVSVRFGFIVRLLKGSRGHIERRKVNGDAWLPTYSHFTGSGRVFFIMRIDLDQVSEFSNYQKRQ